VHLVHRSAADTTAHDYFQERTNSITWHSDVTYEIQPPGTTILYLLDGPPAGGDTLFANMAVAYQRLSPEFRRRLHGLEAVHSAHEQAAAALARGSIVRRTPISNIHPLIRTHPATGEKALFVNPQFTRRIVGFKKEESDFLLDFLYKHIALGADFQARVKWEKGTVVVWDNRVTAHSAILDWQDGSRRHLARLTPQAERPFETGFEGEE
jgi:sulfonate dioxygenase